MTLADGFINFIHEHHLFQKKDRLLIAVSGGVDSVVLCELCHQAGLNFEMAHCNFQLRGEESERDEQFVRTLQKKYGVQLYVQQFDTAQYARLKKISIQVAARELRYEWFDQILKGNIAASIQRDDANKTVFINGSAYYLLTAHHANDNIETVLMNFFKGTGIYGLRGILPKQGKIIRPLLFAKKNELVNFAQQQKLPFVEDSSNVDNKYTRNFFRNQLVPELQQVFPEAEVNILGNIERFNEAALLYQQAVDLHKKKLLEIKGNEVHIPVLKLLKAVPLKTIVYEIIKQYHFTMHQTAGVTTLLNSGSGKYIDSPSHRILRNRNWLIIAPLNDQLSGHILIEKVPAKIQFEGKILTVKSFAAKDFAPPASPLIAALDKDKIRFPLLLRKWKQGDYFYPLGMQKKKKLSRFFIDQKMSLIEKENAWVVESDKKILWVVGKRIDDRFKITPNTKEILELTIS
jgi:tRNA(Ile)-lysidine synthase